MSLGGNLFIKIFVGFWLATIAILGSWLLAARYFDSLPNAGPNHPEHGTPPQFMLRLHYNLENLPTLELAPYVAETERRHRIRVWLINRDGSDLFNREPDEKVLALSARLRGRARRAHARTEGQRLLAFNVYRADLNHFRAVVVIPDRHFPIVKVLGANPWLRILLAFLVSGLICYLLSRLMTRNLKQLQTAARRLATGDLETRINVRESGGDETDELARDFNSMAAQLQERVLAQKRLLSDVSHELRSPLARLRIALALAQQKPADSARFLQRIELDTERLEELITQLLTSESADFDPEGRVDLMPLLQTLCESADFEGRAKGSRVALQTTLKEAVVAGTSDPLRKSFENILRNALTYAEAGSTVRVKLGRLNERFEVRVEDRGPGVPEAELGKIFDSFYRVDNARERETGGYGLGLAIARRAIQQHGGVIRAENTDQGLAIIVQLPAA
jgi:two-component system sensor histidine kinase CpxA